MLALPLAQQWQSARNNISDIAFYFVHGLQRPVPAALQFAEHEPLGGIDASECQQACAT